MISLYDDQKELVNGIRSAIKEGHKRIMVMAATGFGKTRVAAHICEAALEKGNPVLFIADLRTLVHQSAIEFWNLGLDSSVVMADDPRYAPWKNLHVCSAHTLMRRKAPDANLVIVDEAHTHYQYLTELMGRWSNVVFIGLSATPFSRGLGRHYSKLVIGPTTADLISRGRLLAPVCYGPATVTRTGMKTQNGDFKVDDQYKKFSSKKIHGDIVQTYLELGEGRKFILFPVNVEHSKELVNEFNESGIPCAHVDAYTQQEEREEYYKKLNEGELTGLSSVGVLSKGFDETSVSCVILAYVTKSLTKYIQTVGRGLRAHEGQTDCIILDHGGNVETLGFPDDPLPDYLCDGEKTETQKQKERDEEMEEKQLKPKKCPCCDMVVKAEIFTCPKCGHIFAKRSSIDVEQGKLEKIEQTANKAASKRNRTVSKEDKQAFYSSALTHARNKGYKEGWAANKYREYFGVWPNKMNKTYGDITPEFKSYLTACNIRYAKRKANTGTAKTNGRRQPEEVPNYSVNS